MDIINKGGKAAVDEIGQCHNEVMLCARLKKLHTILKNRC